MIGRSVNTGADRRDVGVRLVCFDLGGVLVRICRSWAEACRRAGVEVRDPHAADALFRDGRHAITDYQTGRTGPREFAAEVSRLLGGLYSPHEVARVHGAWVIGEYEGAADIIDSIHKAGLATACLSNTNEVHWRQVLGYPVLAKLGLRLASHELGLHKPDEAIFREAQRLFECAGPEILYFDDVDLNVESAMRLNWNAVQIDPSSRTDEQIRSALGRFGLLQSG